MKLLVMQLSPPSLFGPNIRYPLHRTLFGIPEVGKPPHLYTISSCAGSIIVAGALWITVASVRNRAQSRNNKNDETLRQMAVEKEQLEAKLQNEMHKVCALEIMCCVTKYAGR
jgi:hypothetical protein